MYEMQVSDKDQQIEGMQLRFDAEKNKIGRLSNENQRSFISLLDAVVAFVMSVDELRTLDTSLRTQHDATLKRMQEAHAAEMAELKLAYERQMDTVRAAMT